MEEASDHYVACCHDPLGVGSSGRPEVVDGSSDSLEKAHKR